jgi:hypothetical protein
LDQDVDITAVVVGLSAAGSALVVGVATVTQSLVSQRRQLRHDREIRELQVLRDALDEALTSARRRYGIAGDLRRRRSFGESSLKELADTQPCVPIARAKLLVRLGRAHPVVESYDVVRHELNALVNFITETVGDDESPESREARCSAQAKQVHRALDDFTDKAASVAEIDPAILAAGWGSPSSRQERDQT